MGNFSLVQGFLGVRKTATLPKIRFLAGVNRPPLPTATSRPGCGPNSAMVGVGLIFSTGRDPLTDKKMKLNFRKISIPEEVCDGGEDSSFTR